MSRTVPVRLGKRSYRVWVGAKVLDRAGGMMRAISGAREVIVVSAAPVLRLHGARLKRAFVRAGLKARWLKVPDGEAAKTWAVAGKLLRALARAGARRDSLLVAFGGGSVGDLTGFAAASFARGIRFVQVPTTVAAQVDAAIGGKTGVDLPEGKNLAGAFHQPEVVISDTSVLLTLSARQLRTGLAEVVKYGVIGSPGFFSWLERNADDLLLKDPSVLSRAVLVSTRAKAAVVSADEREAGRRVILNFGHTAGHALEVATGYGRFTHGEAIAIGMVCASRLSAALKLCAPGVPVRIERLLSLLGLPTRPPGDVNRRALLRALQVDKKRVATGQRLVLTRGIGGVTVKRGIGPETVVDTLLRQRKSFPGIR